jgi:hypothetical protein
MLFLGFSLLENVREILPNIIFCWEQNHEGDLEKN